MKFIHCSDIHLGKTIDGNRERYKDYFERFKKVVELTIDEKADFMIIAGDLFHHGSISPSTLADTIEILELLKKKKIPVIAIEGNHDLYHRRLNESWLQFLARRGYLKLLRPVRDPEQGKIILEPFDNEKGIGGWIEMGGLSIYGLGYYATSTAKMLNLTLESLPEKADIGIFHGGVWDTEIITLGRVTSKEIMPLKDRFRYIALGHGHRPYEVEDSEKNTFAFNPGALEIINPEESNRKGSEYGHVYKVEMDGDKMHVKRCRTLRRPYLNHTVVVDEANDSDEVAEILKKNLMEIKEGLSEEKPILILDIQGKIKFSPLDLDMVKLEEVTRSIIEPVYLSISNGTSRFRSSGKTAAGKRKLDEIFKDTILNLVDGHPRYRENKEDILNLIMDMKKNIVDEKNFNRDEIVDMIHRKRMQIDE